MLVTLNLKMDPVKRKTLIRKAYRENAEMIIQEFEVNEKNEAVALMGTKECLNEKVAEIKIMDGEILELMEEEDAITAEVTDALKFSERMTKALSTVNSCLRKVSPVVKLASSVSEDGSSQRARAKLPKIEVPRFDGDILAFRGFWDQFAAAIHSRADLESIEKFSYLKSLLCGSAANLVSGITLSDTNYSKALELLHDRFGNTQSLVAAHMDKLVKIPKVVDISDVNKLRDMYDTLETHIRNLSDLDVNSTTYGTLLISIIFERIPDDLRIIISRELKSDAWVLDDLMRIFKEELYARERCAALNLPDLKPSTSEHTPITSQNLHVYAGKKDRNNKPRKCVYCSSTRHIPSRCDTVTDIKARLDVLRKGTLCFVCLKPNHRARRCQAQYKCVKCGHRHHVSICENTGDQEEIPRYEANKVSPSIPKPKDSHGMHVQGCNSEGDNVMLQVAMGGISNPENSRLRATGSFLFDGGSHRSYVTTEVKKRLRLKTI